ncbi:tryptophan 2,3-dioxygenase [Streptomyces hokutonensis]|uniref:tryptophan 2,3-dioxygenase n=1 Tax=Streptomyces hokutonensis TaxID=1306990 RepID=UPI0036AC6069
MHATETAPAAFSPIWAPSTVDVLETLDTWAAAGNPGPFPYTELLQHLRSVGKHFLADVLLNRLAAIRDGLPGTPATGSTAPQPAVPASRTDDVLFLHAFLDVVLDKHDNRYDYPSYTALRLLTHPVPDDWRASLRSRDELLLLLLADLVRFEQGALTGTPVDPHDMPPSPELAGKRARLAVRVMEAAALRVLPAGTVDPAAVVAVPGRTPAGLLTAEILRAATTEQELMLSASMQPVYVLHDEYLFLRTLQSFETTFGFMSAALATAVRQLDADRAQEAADLVGTVADVLRESLPLFSLLATMRPEAFQTFREFTEGASAIQSAGYKTFESLCSTPALARLDSSAYTSVPGVRARVLDGQSTVQGTWHDLIADQRLDPADDDALRAAADRLESVHQRWKQTHYRLAVRMIGERSGTGYTQGVPYLAAVLDNRLFPAPHRQSTLVG